MILAVDVYQQSLPNLFQYRFNWSHFPVDQAELLLTHNSDAHVLKVYQSCHPVFHTDYPILNEIITNVEEKIWGEEDWMPIGWVSRYPQNEQLVSLVRYRLVASNIIGCDKVYQFMREHIPTYLPVREAEYG